MRLVFMGSPLFAVPTFERLLGSKHTIEAVVTQPDRPAGRGQKLTQTPIKELALKADLPVLQPEKLRGTDFHQTLAAYKPDVLVVVAYGHILRREILDVPRLGSVNAHASLLPAYRGPAPVQWAIVNGEVKTGVTIIKLDEGMDTGDILEAEEVEILEDDDALSLANMLSVIGADLIVKTLDRAEERGALEGTPQDHEKATRAPMLAKEDGHLDWSLRREQLHCRVRGLRPWPGAYSILGGKTIGICAMDLPSPEIEENLPDVSKKRPGEIVAVVKPRGVVVRAADGCCLVTRAKPEGKPEMGAFDLVNGGLLKVGQILT